MTLRTLFPSLVGALWVVSLPAAPAVETARDSAWSSELELYMLLASIEGDCGMGCIQQAPIDVNFGTILENLKIGFMGHLPPEAGQGAYRLPGGHPLVRQ